jgi:single-strand DNA-binding protein
MRRDLNKVQLTGRLGAAPVFRRTAQGSTMMTFRVASNRSWRSTVGDSHASTEWFRIVAWDRLAEQYRDDLQRGSHVYVEGRLQTRRWIDADGRSQIAVEVVASELIPIGG